MVEPNHAMCCCDARLEAKAGYALALLYSQTRLGASSPIVCSSRHLVQDPSSEFVRSNNATAESVKIYCSASSWGCVHWSYSEGIVDPLEPFQLTTRIHDETLLSQRI